MDAPQGLQRRDAGQGGGHGPIPGAPARVRRAASPSDAGEIRGEAAPDGLGGTAARASTTYPAALFVSDWAKWVASYDFSVVLSGFRPPGRRKSRSCSC